MTSPPTHTHQAHIRKGKEKKKERWCAEKMAVRSDSQPWGKSRTGMILDYTARYYTMLEAYWRPAGWYGTGKPRAEGSLVEFCAWWGGASHDLSYGTGIADNSTYCMVSTQRVRDVVGSPSCTIAPTPERRPLYRSHDARKYLLHVLNIRSFRDYKVMHFPR